MTTATEDLPTVSLDFNTSNKGGAWDDRELVNAYDAALLEFHIHNPGPGSWLDKATAALAKGQPLPGANAFDTEWYTAAKPKPKQPAAEEPETRTKRPRTEGPKSVRNPYSSSAHAKETHAARAASPAYAPPSPEAGPSAPLGYEDDDDDEEEVVDDEEDPAAEDEDEAWEEYQAWGDDSYPSWAGPITHGASTPPAAAQQATDQDPGIIFPPPSGEWPGAGVVGHDEAVGFALHAQYWAGYWMGVARGAAQGPAQALLAPAPATVAVKGKGKKKGNVNGLRR